MKSKEINEIRQSAKITETKAELIRENKFLSARNDYGINARKGYPRIMDETDRQICNAFEAGKNWADEHPKSNLVDIDKVCKWLEEHYQQYDEIGLDMYGQLITENLRKDMMEE